MTPDAIALAHSLPLDRVYPPMRWTARWSDGGNLACGLSAVGVHAALAQMLRIPDWYEEGLWLFSEQGHGHRVTGIGQEYDGCSVMAWTSREALARMRAVGP